MTTNDPDAIRDDIERTRSELGSDVDALADKVTPSKIVGRQTDKVKAAVGGVRERVFGVARDARHSASDLGDGASQLPQKAQKLAEGNPLAVGLIAFGVGWLASSLIPASDKESEWGGMIKEKAEPLVGEAKDAAKAVAEDMKEPAKQAADSLKETASDAMGHVKDEATGAASEVRDHGTSAAQHVKDQGTQP
ncbi:DUF3618 domain-containing protein [Homoserinimonas hongtaonis]|uniref:DUF3618 domain-containing protein n=1 Tax=Homoserinimonas hongtaonis TaxID=2079791 RepID=A0A2U1T243_9MICO|nr:DUF3618 domain-containing protein [Salinibacterium hongtaonis]PWB97843.1 hypothetical protein DF220_08380 [Salinibacterium hongtaonis]